MASEVTDEEATLETVDTIGAELTELRVAELADVVEMDEDV